MKRFRWPLQRLLDVTAQRERALRLELFRLSQQLAAVHQEIFRRQASLRAALSDLAGRAVEERLPEQQTVMECSAAQEAELDRLREDLRRLRETRSETVAAFTRARSSRETLERLRREAIDRWNTEARKQEQKALDESSQVAFARQLLGMRTGSLD